MERGYTDQTDYAAYGYDPHYYNLPPAHYQQQFMYPGYPYSNQQFMTWNPAGGAQYYQPQGFNPYYQDTNAHYESYGFANGYTEGQSQDGENGNGAQTRKYSYSQNRNRNRQRPDSKSNQSSSNAIGNNSPDNEVDNTEADADKENAQVAGYQTRSSDNRYSGDRYNRSRYNGNEKQFSTNHKDRKYSNKYSNQQYNKSQDSKSSYERKEFEVSTGDLNMNANNDSNSSDSRPQQSRPSKSYSSQRYRDERNKSRKGEATSNQQNTHDNEDSNENSRHEERTNSFKDKSRKYDKYPKDIPIEDGGILEADNSVSANESSNGARKKKKETFLFSSSGHREGRNATDIQNQQRSQNRYNYRGMDYNKRHKDEPGLERGSERTKLSEKPNQDGDNDDNVKKSDRDYPVMKKNTNYSSHNKGSRMKRQITLDESQRGVLIEQLTKGTYECMVCCESVRSQNAVWSCSNCYHVFHLRCVKRWAKSPNAIVSGAEKDGWRCPACQNLSFKFPNQYRCFCGKVKDPEPLRMDIPHSCGDVCKKNRGEGCKHPCNILCHPGPCPECNATVIKSCDCGKTKQTVKCGQSVATKCDSECERLLNCGKHFCTLTCHPGPCQKCEKTMQQECYGEHESREVICGSEESFTESYSCKTICGKILDCGNHTCESRCHRGDCRSCPGLPSNVTHCPCGSTALEDLGDSERTSCSDPIPTCDNICNKKLTCGPAEDKHRCKQKCHEGPCGPCDGETMLTCRCLYMDKKFKCADITQSTDENGRFICDKRCNRKKSCGKHKCTIPCCIKEEHPCNAICGKKLACGLHKCQEPCHRNNCPSCLMANFDEVTCYCGAEILYPPVPCGTKPPECHQPCTRTHTCEHPVRHSCHMEDTCPLCTELTKKWCMGKHVERANIPCHLQDISCGMKCSKPLPCGEHSCQKICHKSDCLEEGQKCTQPCRRKRESCEHICGLPCHGEQPCPPSICKAPVTIKCACGHRETKSQCTLDDTSDSAEYQKITMQSLKESLMSGASVSISKFNQGKIGSNRILECNEECAKIERNRRLALALEIQNPDLSGKLGNPSYTDFLKEYAKQNEQFVANIEKALSDLVQTAKQSKQVSRSHAFPSMNNNQRRVVHELAEFYGCETQSYDYEPNKNVVATAKRDKCWLPSVTLTSLVQRELHPRAPPPIPHVHKEETIRQSSLALKLSTSVLRDSSSKGVTPDGWHVIGKKTKKSVSAPKSAIATIDKFEENLSGILTSGKVDYNSLSKESKEALKAEPVVDYFDFTVN